MGLRERNEWIERKKERVLENAGKTDECLSDIMYLFDEAANGIENEIHAMFQKYAKDNALSEAEASRLLSGAEYTRWRRPIAEYVRKSRGDAKILLELNTLSAKSRISRKEAMLANIYKAMAELSGDSETKLTDLLSDLYRTNYQRGCYEIQSVLRIGFSVSDLHTEELMAILRHPWSGENYSAHLWVNTDKLAALARREITLGFMSGASAQSMAKEINDVMGKGRYAAMRLVRTESSYFANQGELRSYRELGVGKYRYLGGGCEICARLNGHVFPLSEAEPGVNMPPMHPNCKCTILPETERNLFEERGNIDPLKGNERFQDWKKRYLKDNAPADLMGKPEKFSFTREQRGLFGTKKVPVQIKAYKVDGAENIFTQTNSKDAQRTIHALKGQIGDIGKKLSTVKEIIVSKPETFPGIAGYDHVSGRLFVNEKITNEEFLRRLIESGDFPARSASDILLHELTHKDHWEAAERFYRTNPGKYGTIKAAKKEMEQELRSYVMRQKVSDPLYIYHTISKNAGEGFEESSEINELIADAEVLISQGKLFDSELARLIGECLK